MLRRPSLRASVTTMAVAVVLVGSAGLASYAANGHVLSHGHGAASASSQPKTIKFHLGAPGRNFNGNTLHILAGKVPTGIYQVGMSGLVSVNGGTGTASYTCLIADKKDLLKLLNGSSSDPDLHRVYAADGANESADSSRFGFIDATNHAQKVDRSKIAFGCAFNDSSGGTFEVKRTITFTFRPVKVDNKSGTPIPLAKSQLHNLARLAH